MLSSENYTPKNNDEEICCTGIIDEHPFIGLLSQQAGDVASQPRNAIESIIAKRKSDSKNGYCCNQRDCVCGYSFFFWS
jgi:hypothetical protein